MPSPTVKSYTFRVELADSQDPVISRTFSLPASSTFERLHHAIQFCFGWRNEHLHEFNFRTGDSDAFSPRTVFMRLGRPHPDDDDFGTAPAMVDEKAIKLRDIWGENGQYRSIVDDNGQISPLWYTYDFGDNWEHKISFVGARDTHKRKFKLIAASGGSPLEDCGGVYGWEEIKEAFAASRPTEEQQERKEWCFQISAKGRSFNPTVEPTFEEMNDSGVFVRYARAYHRVETDDEDSPDESSQAREGHSSRPRSAGPAGLLDDTTIASLPCLPRPPIQELIRVWPAIENAFTQRRFVPPEGTASPFDLFKPMINACTAPGPRWIYQDPASGLNCVLILTEGYAMNEGQENARVGYSVIFRPDAQVEIAQPLEFVPGYAITQDRAHLRAAIAALKLRHWPGEGFRRIVLGTTSEYVVQNAGENLERWRTRRWKYGNNRAIKNKDLWKLLLGELERWEGAGTSVQFYLLDSQWAERSRQAAKKGATSDQPSRVISDIAVAGD